MRRLDFILSVLALGSVLATVSAVAGAEWWVLELASHFRPQYVLAQGVLVTVLALRARWLWCSALAPFLALNLVSLAPYWPQQAAQAAVTGETLRLVSANLNGRNAEHARFLDLVEAEPPDVLLLVEFSAPWREAARRLHGTYAHRVEITRDDAFGVALYSRRPFLEQHTVELQTSPAIDVRVSVSGRALRILGVHLRPPVSASSSAERDRQLSDLAAIAAEETGPLIVLGDFNISPYSPVYASTLGGTGLRDGGRARGWNYSWPTFLPLLGVPIDLCMISRHLVVVEHRRGPAFGSDHYPMFVTVALR